MELYKRGLLLLASAVVVYVSIDTLQEESLSISSGVQNDNLIVVVLFQIIFYACLLIGVLGVIYAIKGFKK